MYRAFLKKPGTELPHIARVNPPIKWTTIYTSLMSKTLLVARIVRAAKADRMIYILPTPSSLLLENALYYTIKRTEPPMKETTVYTSLMFKVPMVARIVRAAKAARMIHIAHCFVTSARKRL
ncbi:CRE-MGL-2 protein [Corchorus capsularis]|uniref:CRE-MGL-2 protein n=1 Tax=Corchorus capsularis TaxID=210143 RepID=A0A1R3GYK7_COCAP|nr:CRE-MGL-2 protein [Corchorus capsularis]